MKKFKNRKNIILVDIGTHFGQEIRSFTDTNFFFFKIFKRLLKILIFKNKSNIAKYLNQIYKTFKTHIKLKKLTSQIKIIIVEPNINHFQKKIYKKADFVVPLAMGSNDRDLINTCKLYISNNDLLSQGNSIYKNKSNINENKFINTISLNPIIFAKLIKQKYIGKNSKIILRVNCEGSEDDIIYAFEEVFKSDLLGILGALKDVKDIKGIKAFNKLGKFIKGKNIFYKPFSEDIDTWYEAHKFLIKEINA